MSIKKVLLIGNGAREHVIAETLKKSAYDVEIFVIGGAKNPGLAKFTKEYLVGDVCDLDLVRKFALETKPDFAILGPEAPIAAGVADMLLDLEVHCASPLQTVARLESSKSFTRDLLENYQIPGNPKFKVFYDEIGLKDFFDELGDDFVVKADGLKGGKGVKVSGDHLKGKEEGLKYAQECLKDAGRVVVEEKLIGQEFSLMSFCDGVTTIDMPAVQDHKRAYDGDKGPNTGGMGSYSCADHSLPFLTAKDVSDASEITKNVAKALFDDTGVYFKGIMYGGFIVTKDGVKLIEYNARFGDPEAMNVLPLLKTDFVDICEGIIHKTLDHVEVKFDKKATVCKYVVPDGYPDNPVSGKRIVVKDVPKDVLTYYASVDLDCHSRECGNLILSGSRAIAFVGIADELGEAEKLASSAVGSVVGPVFYRGDIGTSELLNEKIRMMEKLR